jgi:hypothetical protein
MELKNHLRTDHERDILKDFDTEPYLVCPANRCPLCCLPLEKTDGKSSAKISEKQATPLPQTIEDPSPVKVDGVPGKEVGKSVKWASDHSSEEPKIPPDVDESLPPPWGSIEMSRHIATHLQFLAFLTLRLLPNALAEGEYREFSSSVSIT